MGVRPFTTAKRPYPFDTEDYDWTGQQLMICVTTIQTQLSFTRGCARFEVQTRLGTATAAYENERNMSKSPESNLCSLIHVSCCCCCC
jgi:hypothetical protein